MKQQVFYIHGGESYANNESFLERLKTKDIWDLPGTDASKKWTHCMQDNLGDTYEVFMPAMPNKQNAKYEEWKIWFERHFEHLRDDLILMGCSLGAMFVTKYLTEHTPPFRIKALYLMASPVPMDDFDDSDCGDFMCDLSKVGQLTELTDKIYILHSKDDFLVPYEHALLFKEALPEAELVTFEDKGHFLIEEFPELVESIRNLD